MSAKKIPSSAHKGARALTHYLAFHLVLPYVLEYLICLASTWVASVALFHGRLDSPVAAIGVLAVGNLGRYFLKPRPAPQQPFMAMPMQPGLLDALLAPYVSDEHQDAAASAAADKLSGPYL